MVIKTKPAKPPLPPDDPDAIKIDWGNHLTTFAFFLAMALVVARATMLEILRDPFFVNPASAVIPRGPGPTATLVLDLLCCVPALLVLIRRAIDRTYFIRNVWSFLPLAALGVWTLCSTLWAADRFAAAVGSVTWLSAGILLWSMSQLVRSWLRLRIVAATCTGLLLILIAAGAMYRFLDLPDLQRNWQKQSESILSERGWDKDSFAAQQFQKKVLSGELAGFSASPNTFAAVIVLCVVVTAGLIIQRLRDGDGVAVLADSANNKVIARDAKANAPLNYFAADSSKNSALAAVLPILFLVGGFWAIYYTDSRTALATPVIAALMLLCVWRLQPWLATHAKMAYWIGVGIVLLGTVALIGHGMAHGSLGHVSLTFRWKYWTGAMRIVRANPIFGIGWDNFGLYYLSARLAEAAEEVKDPHNFVVRAFAEAGIIGGVLMIAWVARMWWELTRPVVPAAAMRRPSPSNAVVYFSALAVVTVVINIVAAVDFSMESAFVWFELIKRVLWILLFILGALSVTLMSLQKQDFDDRPAPWLLYAMIAGVAVFFVHNLIDFSLFENGSMFLFAMVAGSALGARLPAPADRPRRRTLSITMLVIGALAWLGVAFALLMPTADAEQWAQKADSAIRARELFSATQQYDAASRALPLNTDYAFRAARALIQRDAPRGEVLARLGVAIGGNPMRAEYVLTRARYELSRPPAERDMRQIQQDFETAARIDPHDVDIHLEFARAMEPTDRELALRQYQTALDANAALLADEPKRLPEKEVEKVRERIEALSHKH